MNNSKIKEIISKLLLEIENSNDRQEDTEFLEELRELTGSVSIEEMLERFKKLAGLE